jgi:hypothetical protein
MSRMSPLEVGLMTANTPALQVYDALAEETRP